MCWTIPRPSWRSVTCVAGGRSPPGAHGDPGDGAPVLLVGVADPRQHRAQHRPSARNLASGTSGDVLTAPILPATTASDPEPSTEGPPGRPALPRRLVLPASGTSLRLRRGDGTAAPKRTGVCLRRAWQRPSDLIAG